MKVPIEFEALGSAFYAGSFLEGMTIEEWLDAQLSALDARQKRVSLAFLDELLADDPDIGTLQDVWRSSDSDFCVNDTGILVFLKMLREALAK